MTSQFPQLFRPYRFRTFEVKNRLVMPPMAIYVPGSNGFVEERLLAYYEARAKGGVGFIIVNATYVNPNGASHPNQTSIMDDKFIPGLARLADMFHEHGVPTAIQLYHSGRQRYALIAGGETMSPSGIPDPIRKDPTRPMTVEKIEETVDDYGQAARRAREAGFDAIEIHCAHGYLLSGFLSPYQNQRTDDYGGSILNRTRIVREILDRCREMTGNDLVIGVRINGSDYVNGGNTLEDAKEIARILTTGGAEYVHVSAGMAPSAQYSFLPSAIPQGQNVKLAEGIKEAVGDIPVIACGAIEDPFFAEKVLRERPVDFVAMGRPLFADPNLPNKAREGRTDEIRPCLRCSKGAAVWPEDMRCTVNPAVGNERVFEENLATAELSRNVLVIGAGPAGLEAARICAIRGHNVTVIEREDRLGGKIRLAMRLPKNDNHRKWIDYYQREMERLAIDVRLNHAVTVTDVEAMNPDVVLVATGGRPLILDNIPGADLPGIVTADDVLWDKAKVGDTVAIIGGSSMGLETADYVLSKRPCRVTVIEMLPTILSDISHDAELALLDKLVDKDIRFLTDTKLSGIVADGDQLALNIKRYDMDQRLSGYDTVIMAIGVRSDNVLGVQLMKTRENVHCIGDAEGSGDYRKAVHDAADIAIAV